MHPIRERHKAQVGFGNQASSAGSPINGAIYEITEQNCLTQRKLTFPEGYREARTRALREIEFVGAAKQSYLDIVRWILLHAM